MEHYRRGEHVWMPSTGSLRDPVAQSEVSSKARANVILLIMVFLLAFGDVSMLLTTQWTRSCAFPFAELRLRVEQRRRLEHLAGLKSGNSTYDKDDLRCKQRARGLE
jgi:hypothetical protein